MRCRCGHGRQWHKRPAKLSGWQRQRGAKSKGRTPCTFGKGWTGAAAERWPQCKCRDWHPEGQA